jgi:HD superfamily phosphohydrolase
VTRYEHSLGVANLAAMLGLGDRDQLAALLHDTTHAAFSHTIDHLLGDSGEATHDKRVHRIAAHPDLRSTLGDDRLRGVVAVLESRPSWLRQLDRYDYTHRDLVCAELLDPAQVPTPPPLHLVGDKIAFTSPDEALQFMHRMLQASIELYLDPYGLYFHQELAAVLTEAAAAGVLTLDDILDGTDTSVLHTLDSHPASAERIARLRTTRRNDLEIDPTAPTITTKARVFVPLVATGSAEVVGLETLTGDASRILAAAQRASTAGQPRLRHREPQHR